MTNVLIIFSVIVLSLSLFTWATIWSRMNAGVRTASLVGFLLLAIAAYPAMFEVLGWPKPLSVSWRLDGETTVLSYKLDPGEAIYLYIDGDPEPRSVVMGWSEETAEKLYKAGRRSRGGGDKTGKFKMKFNWSLDKHVRPEFYVDPPESHPPEKDPPPAAPLYDRSSQRGSHPSDL